MLYRIGLKVIPSWAWRPTDERFVSAITTVLHYSFSRRMSVLSGVACYSHGLAPFSSERFCRVLLQFPVFVQSTDKRTLGSSECCPGLTPDRGTFCLVFSWFPESVQSIKSAFSRVSFGRLHWAFISTKQPNTQKEKLLLRPSWPQREPYLWCIALDKQIQVRIHRVADVGRYTPPKSTPSMISSSLMPMMSMDMVQATILTPIFWAWAIMTGKGSTFFCFMTA